MNTAKVKQLIRRILGDRIATWVHAIRFARLACCTSDDEPDRDLTARLLQLGDVAVDVGANGADWTYSLSKGVGGSGRVFAFEADPYYAEVTQKTLRLLSLNNVHFFPFGLSDTYERAQLRVFSGSHERLSGQGRVERNPDESAAQDPDCVVVHLQRLDAMLDQYPDLRRTRLIKCDVEGFELMVFRGAHDVIAASLPVIVAEVGGAHLHGYADTDVFDYLEAIGYTSYVAVTPTRLRPSRAPGAIPEGPRPNRVFLPPGFDASKYGVGIEQSEGHRP